VTTNITTKPVTFLQIIAVLWHGCQPVFTKKVRPSPKKSQIAVTKHSLHQGRQLGPRDHQVAHKDQVGRPRACSENNISMINVFALTNINIKIIEA